MTQRSLALWDNPELVTYTEVETYRARAYPRQGPSLLETLREEVEAYASDEDPARLRVINSTVLTLASLNTDWFDFSVDVFRACILPAQTPPKMLHGLFESALRRMAKVA